MQSAGTRLQTTLHADCNSIGRCGTCPELRWQHRHPKKGICIDVRQKAKSQQDGTPILTCRSDMNVRL